MEENINEQEKYILNKISNYLKLKEPVIHSSTLKESVKELCVARLCKSIGIKCQYNYKSDFFEFFSQVTAEAVCDKLNIKLRIAPDSLRLFRYEHINLVDRVRSYLDYESVDEAFIESFNFLDRFKYIIPTLK